MELWFWAAVIAAIFSGVGNFLLKSAAHRGYSSEMFILIGGLVSTVLSLPLALFVSGFVEIPWLPAIIALIGGLLSAGGAIAKVHALRHIDTTIFFPLFKFVSPALAIVFGITFFGETFTFYEWVGLGLGMLIPLLLICKAENKRQNNLLAGLILVLVAGGISAGSWALNVFSLSLFPDALWILVFASVGVFFGSLFLKLKKVGSKQLLQQIKIETTNPVIVWGSVRALFMTVSFAAALYAFVLGGTLAVVHTIQSFYILISIVLAIIIYKEHWNAQKIIAILLSVLALGLLG